MKVIDKPWGREDWIEVNDAYVMKKLVMNKGHKCSIQYHEVKKETLYVLSGKLAFYHGTDVNDLTRQEMGPGDTFTIQPGYIHRMEALEDSEYLEASTPELDDVVRLVDEYDRV